MTPEENLPPINFNKPPAAQAATAPTGLSFARMDALDPSSPALPNYGSYAVAADRPRGVMVIAVLNFVAAALIGLGTLLVLAAGDDTGSADVLVAIVQVVLSVAVGIGLLRLQRWAYWTAVVLYALNAVLAVLNFFVAVNLVSIIQLILAVIIVSYLIQAQIRGAFE